MFRDKFSYSKWNSDDHIYENVSNRYKYGILNGVISSFTSKAKDFSLKARKRDKYIHGNNKCPSPMNEYDLTHFNDDTSIFERNFEYQMDREYSYTSCEDDNIYENLEFFNDQNFNNSSLNDWMLNLTHDVAEYETDNIMFVKSIPSIFSVHSRTHHRSQLDKNEITLKFLKILWNGESNVDIMSLLLQTFSNLLRDQNKQRHSYGTDYSSIETKVSSEKVSLRKLNKTKKKKNYQKFETVILSSSLNTFVITYNKSQKFYFALVHSDILVKLPVGVKVNQILLAIKTNFKFNLEFYKVLRVLLRHKLMEISAVKAQVEQDNPNNTSAIENIYQQIWTCQSISNGDKAIIINSENIYSSLDYARASDDSEWEVDDEFSFMNPKVLMGNDKMMNQSVYKTVWVYYNDENPEYNKIVYDSTAFMESTSSLKGISTDESLSVDVPHAPQNDVGNKCEIPKNWCESIEAWKDLLRSPYYCEDEEDIIVSESLLSSNFTYYNDTEDESNKSVTVHSSSFSLQLDESSSIKSSHESYRSLSEDIDLSDKPTSSPKRERFRDKFKFKTKTGKLNIEGNSTESLLSKADDDADKFIVFGCNLEKVEKDNVHRDVPKIIVECINILELSMNIKTPGIYRISGNKNTIDAIKKKFNGKKQSKKESRQEFLQDQDVHTLTGLLKMFFRELKSPLMTKQIFTQCTSEKHSADQMGKILKEMPIYSYATLKYLFRHLKIIEKYQNENLMNSGNLAICLGLCLFSNSFGEAPNPFDSDISKCNMLCKYLIDNYYEVFESKDEAR